MRSRLAAAWLLLMLPVLPGLDFAAAAPGQPVVTNAWARATPPGTTVGAAYVSIEGGAIADRLVAARINGAANVEFHEVRDESGVARMRQLVAVDIAPGSHVVFAPGGLHMMLIGLERPLVSGERRTLTLEFERAGRIDVELQVRPATITDHEAEAAPTTVPA